MKFISFFVGILLVVFAVSNFGCKSNPVVMPLTNNGKPEITIIPDSLHGWEFIEYTFKAKISNYDLAQTYFLWDMGDGSQINRDNLSYQKSYTYLRPGVFNITVNAYDIYSDSVIASKSIKIFIDTVRASI